MIMISSMQGALPDRNKTMFKKAYSVVERTVGELVNDETLYPYDENRIGFNNTDNVTIPGTNTVAGGARKFCELFISKLNTIGTPQYSGQNCVIDTSDGVTLMIPANATFPKVITVDVNGAKEPNSLTGENRDRYQINVLADGRVNVTGTLESEYLKSNNLQK